MAVRIQDVVLDDSDPAMDDVAAWVSLSSPESFEFYRRLTLYANDVLWQSLMPASHVTPARDEFLDIFWTSVLSMALLFLRRSTIVVAKYYSPRNSNAQCRIT